jgi:hypothetical protein
MPKFNFKKFLRIVEAFAPVVLSNVPKGEKIAPLIPVIIHGIQEAEQIPGASGAEKKAHVLEVVSAGVTAVNATGKVKLDPVEVADIASKGVDLTVQIVNDVHAAHPGE